MRGLNSRKSFNLIQPGKSEKSGEIVFGVRNPFERQVAG
jgi:hypothetical protein